MATTVDDYKLKIGVQGQGAVNKLSNSIQNLSKDIGSLGNSNGILGNSLSSLTGKLGPVGLAAGAVAAAFGALGAKALLIADQIGDISAATGISAGSLMNFKESLIQAGGSAQSFEQFAKKLSLTIGEANKGNLEYQKSFKNLGVYVRDANGQLRPTGDILRDTISALGQIKDTSTRAALAAKLLGEEAARIDWTNVAAGKDAITDKQIADLNKFNASIEKLTEMLNRKVVSFFGSIANDILDTFGLLDDFDSKVKHAFNALQAERDAAGTGEFAGLTSSPYEGLSDADLKTMARDKVRKEIDALNKARQEERQKAADAAEAAKGKGGSFGGQDPKIELAHNFKLFKESNARIIAEQSKHLNDIGRLKLSADKKLQEDIKAIQASETLNDQQKAAEILSAKRTSQVLLEKQIADVLKNQKTVIDDQLTTFNSSVDAAQQRLDLENKLILATEQERTTGLAIFDLNAKYAAQVEALNKQKKDASQTTIDAIDKEIAGLNQALVLQQAQLKAAIDKQAYSNSQKEYDAQIKILSANRETYGWQAQREDLERAIANQSERNKTVARQLLTIEEQRASKLKEIAALTVLDANKKQNLMQNVNSEYDRQRELIEENYRRESEAQDSFVGGWTGAFEQWRNGLKTNAEYAADTFSTMTAGLENAFVKFVQTGKLSFKDLANSMIADFAKMQAQKMFAQLIGGGNPLTSLFGGFFADGGTLGAGKWGIAGEAGPEIIQGPANIIPMQKTATTSDPGQTVITYNINATDAASFKSMVARDPQFLYAVTEQGRRGLPGRR